MKKIEEKLNRFNCKKILIVPDVKIIEQNLKEIEIWDVSYMLELIKKM